MTLAEFRVYYCTIATRSHTMLIVLLTVVIFAGLVVRANILHTPVEGYSE